MLQTQPSLPMLIASKFLPLLVRRSCRMGTASGLISFSDGGGDPSTHPFHPFLAATRFFLSLGLTGADILPTWRMSMSSWSSGV